MHYLNLQDFLSDSKKALVKGPVALILVEDLVEVNTTVRHHLLAGFNSVVVFAPPELSLPDDIAKDICRVDFDTTVSDAIVVVVNAVITVAPDIWIYYCYNAEYLFYPFCESRTIVELIAFHTEERRDAALGYVVDLYADDLASHPLAVSLDNACLDKSGYYALARPDPKNDNHPKKRQLNFYGGLRWRYEEHIPEIRHKIDRIPLFRSAPGLKLNPDHTFNNEEYNTYSCPWHHNITLAIASFRTAKA
ncbi:MAG: hypothetical protein ACU0C9_10770, partial [Paracoccaceae bacterium]